MDIENMIDEEVVVGDNRSENEVDNEYDEDVADSDVDDEGDGDVDDLENEENVSDQDDIDFVPDLDIDVELDDSDVESEYASENELRSPPNSDDEMDWVRMQSKARSRARNAERDVEFYVNKTYKSPTELKEKIKDYAIRKFYNVKIVKNDKLRVTAKCVLDCRWRLHASVVSDDNTFQIKTYYGEHACARELHNRNVNSTWVAKTYIERFRSNQNMPLSELIDAVRTDFEVEISRSQAYRAKKKALKKINGTIVEQYKRLRDYAHELLRSNEGSTVKIMSERVTDEAAPIFKRMYICFKALKDGFRSGCRPIIALDGCHLTGPCQGILMAAVGIDGNNSLYPICWAITEAETRDSWTWFLCLLQDDIGSFEVNRYTFISDQQKGLVPTFEHIFPNVDHRFCCRHLYANFKKQFKGTALQTLFWNAASAATQPEFNAFMTDIGNLNVAAYQYLNGVPTRYWSKHAFSTNVKCDLLLNNISESFNAYILDTRDKPIMKMLEMIRKRVMVRLAEKNSHYSKQQGFYGKRILMKLNKNRRQARYCVSQFAGNSLFEVTCNETHHRVDVASRSCTCRMWNLTGIHCAHAIASITLYLRRNLEEFLDVAYHKDTMLNIYSNYMIPTSGSHLWPTLYEDPLLPPKIKRPTGRPKKQRRRDVDEAGTSQRRRIQSSGRCKRCRSEGHNIRSCKGPLPNTSARRNRESRTTFMGFSIPNTDSRIEHTSTEHRENPETQSSVNDLTGC